MPPTAAPELSPHPRLYLGEKELARADQAPSSPLIEAASRRVAELAEVCLGGPDFEYPEGHNSLLLRARLMQGRVVSLLLRWGQTGEARYRQAALDHLQRMGQWTYWSWILRRRGETRFDEIFDLSYGENSATLAIAYTWLYTTLTQAQAAGLRDMAAHRSLAPFLVHTRADRAGFWFRNPQSNWNSVCSGGAGMLALAMYEDLADAPEVLGRAESSIEPYMAELDQTGGGWPEGIGYWNYGMRYALMYLLSHERATGRPHPLLERPGAAATLSFPMDFCPRGVGCSFGDVNAWSPLPFHYAAAERLHRRDLIPTLDRRLSETNQKQGHKRSRSFGANQVWPRAAELVLLHPTDPEHEQVSPDAAGPEPKPTQGHVLRHYPTMDWAMLADRWPTPTFYASVRGGSTDLPHSNQDLMSLNVLVGARRVLRNAEIDQYIDTTFGDRRRELFEDRPHAKNTLLVNGVGLGDSVVTTTHQLPGIKAVRLTRGDPPARPDEDKSDPFVGRLVMLLEPRLLVVVDRVVLPHIGRAEARWLSPFAPSTQASAARWTTDRGDTLHGGFAATTPAGLHLALTAPTSPEIGASLHMLRWCAHGLHTDVIFAAAFCPDQPVTPNIEAGQRRIALTLAAPSASSHVLIDAGSFTPTQTRGNLVP